MTLTGIKLNVSIDSYYLQVALLGMTLCALRRKVADLMFPYDLYWMVISIPPNYSQWLVLVTIIIVV